MNLYFKKRAKKRVLVILIISVVFLLIGCEDDAEICTEAVTPRMLIKFYDFDTHEASSINNVVITNATDTLYVSTTEVDSVFIPLSVTENTEVFKIKVNEDADIIQFNFDREEEYLSKGCGIKVTYKNMKYDHILKEEIKKIELNNEIIDESESHLRIYY